MATAKFGQLIEQLTATFEEHAAENRHLSSEVSRLGHELARARCDVMAAQASAMTRQLSGVHRADPAMDMVSILPSAQTADEMALPHEVTLPGRDAVVATGTGAAPLNLKMTNGSHYHRRRDCVIDPNKSIFMSVWDMVTMPALLWVALITPVQIGVLVDQKFDAFFICSLTVDFIFIVDLVLQFFIAYPVPGKSVGYLERRHSKIIKHYLTGWFTIELVTVIPFDLISMSFNADEINRFKAIRVIRTLRLLKLARILKASRVFHRAEIALPLPYQRLALLKFICILVLVCHWQASVWAMTLQISEESEERWIDAVPGQSSAVLSKRPASLYVAAFYFCCYTMTSVGYGDIGPKNTFERIVCTAIILVSGLCWAYILGEVCGIVSDLNEEAQSFRKRMDNLNDMLEERGVPEQMKRRLRSFFLSSRSRSEHMTQQQLLSNMSSTLQGEVSLLLNKDWIAKVSFLREFLEEVSLGTESAVAEAYRSCIADVARNMDTMALSQSETFLKIQRLHIIYKGLIAIGDQVLQKGDVWGEDFVLSDVTLVDARRCCALTYAELMFIDRTTFMDVVEDHKYACPQLKAKVRRWTVRLAVRRGVLAEGRRRTHLKKKKEVEMVYQGMSSGGSKFQGHGSARPEAETKPEFILPNMPS